MYNGPFYTDNLAAATRKPFLTLFGCFPMGTDLSWIRSVGYTSPSAVNGTVDGSNAVFTIADSGFTSAFVFVDGIKYDPPKYTLNGATITFNYPYIPAAGSVITAIVS
jgi:hypothetical protein